jgi:hypothetical protein
MQGLFELGGLCKQWHQTAPRVSAVPAVTALGTQWVVGACRGVINLVPSLSLPVCCGMNELLEDWQCRQQMHQVQTWWWEHAEP